MSTGFWSFLRLRAYFVKRYLEYLGECMSHEEVHRSSVLSIVGRPCPEFLAEAIVEGKTRQVSSGDFLGRWLILLFYTADFSQICPTEMHSLQEHLTEFAKRRVHVGAVSTDSIEAHFAWLQRPREEGGIAGVRFMLVSDIKKEVARAFAVLDEKSGTALRGTFLIDPEGRVQHGSVYGFEMGRNIAELLRIVDAVQFSQKHGVVCPVNWELGKEAIPLRHDSIATYYKKAGR